MPDAILVPTAPSGEGAPTPDQAVSNLLDILYSGRDRAVPIVAQVRDVLEQAGLTDDPDFEILVEILSKTDDATIWSTLTESYAKGTGIATAASAVLVALGATALNIPVVGAVLAALLVAASAITAFAGDLNARNDAEHLGFDILERVAANAALINPSIDAASMADLLKGGHQLDAPADAWIACRLLEVAAVIAGSFGAVGMHGTLWTGSFGDVYTSASDWRAEPDYGSRRLARAVNLSVGTGEDFICRPTAIARPGFQRGILHAIGGSMGGDYARGAGHKSLRRTQGVFGAMVGIKAFLAAGRTPEQRQGLFAALVLACESITSGVSRVENWRKGEALWVNEFGVDLKGAIARLPPGTLPATFPGRLQAPGPYVGRVRFSAPPRQGSRGIAFVGANVANYRSHLGGRFVGGPLAQVTPEFSIWCDGTTPIAVWACRMNYRFTAARDGVPFISYPEAERVDVPDPVLVWFGVPAGAEVRVELPEEVWNAPRAGLGPRCAVADPGAVKWCAESASMFPPNDVEKWWGAAAATAAGFLYLRQILNIAPEYQADDLGLVTIDAGGPAPSSGIGGLVAVAAGLYLATR